MAKVYYRLVKAGKWNLEDVPVLWRDEVAKMIELDNSQVQQPA